MITALDPAGLPATTVISAQHRQDGLDVLASLRLPVPTVADPGLGLGYAWALAALRNWS